jgi:hypothetical protein
MAAVQEQKAKCVQIFVSALFHGFHLAALLPTPAPRLHQVHTSVCKHILCTANRARNKGSCHQHHLQVPSEHLEYPEHP